MKKQHFKAALASLFLAVCTLNSIGQAEAAPVADECAREILLSYFPAPMVNETLKKFDVPQDKWSGITSSLSSKDKDVVKIVEQRASAMNPNPLKDPQQRQAAVKLFKETLLEVFTDAMKQNGLTDTSKFQAMLDDIQQQKAKKFAMCLEKQKGQPAPSNLASQPNITESDDDSDDDDSDDDDDDSSDDDDDSDDSSDDDDDDNDDEDNNG